MSETTFIMVLMAIRPLTAATTIPTSTGPSWAISKPFSKAAGTSKTAEPRMDGIEIKNTNFENINKAKQKFPIGIGRIQICVINTDCITDCKVEV